jgi:hypothetical protein
MLDKRKYGRGKLSLRQEINICLSKNFTALLIHQNYIKQEPNSSVTSCDVAWEMQLGA